ncbi:MAG: methyl-accepting chemotaxis protein [Bacillota bacterium]
MKLKKFLEKSLLVKLLIPFIMVLLVSTFAGSALIINYLKELPMEQEVSRLRSVAIQLDSIWGNMESTHQHILRQTNINSYNAASIGMYEAIATVRSFSEKMKTENTSVGISAENPKNRENSADEWETSVIGRFKADEKLLEGYEILEDENSTYLRYAMPIKLDEYCLSCHAGGVGDVHGVFSMTTSLDDLIAQSKLMSTFVFLAGGLIIILLGAFMWFVSRRVINRPLNEINKQLKDLNSGEGDLTYQLKAKSEDIIGKIAGQFNAFLSFLRGMFTQINASSSELEQAAVNISAGIVSTRQLLANNSEQVSELVGISATLAENLVEIRHSSEEVANSATHISILTQESFEESEEVSKEALESGESMDRVVSSVSHVHDKVGELEAVFELLKESIDKITGFVTNINDIATQTNMLALNAAIESQRAGEAGRGFAVVAEEVRGLAEHSAQAAKEISQIIRELADKTQAANNHLQESGEAVNHSKQEVEEAQKRIKSIIQRIEQIGSNIQGVSAASQQQSAASEEISASINEVSRFGAQTAQTADAFSKSIQEQLASMEEIEEAVLSLERVAKETSEMINKFKV